MAHSLNHPIPPLTIPVLPQEHRAGRVAPRLASGPHTQSGPHRAELDPENTFGYIGLSRTWNKLGDIASSAYRHISPTHWRGRLAWEEHIAKEEKHLETEWAWARLSPSLRQSWPVPPAPASLGLCTQVIRRVRVIPSNLLSLPHLSLSTQ